MAISAVAGLTSAKTILRPDGKAMEIKLGIGLINRIGILDVLRSQANKTASIGLALALIAGCQTAKTTAESEPPKPTPYKLSSVETEKVKAAVRPLLLKPESAVFSKEQLAFQRKSTGVVFVCGSVNGLNEKGQYGGHHLYAAVLKNSTVGKIMFYTNKESTESKLTGQICVINSSIYGHMPAIE